MSIINRSHRFIFVHVPKTAGTSVTRSLSTFTAIGDVEIGGSEFGETLAVAYGKRFGLRKHSTASEIRSVVGSEVWETSFKFAIVRNPYARAYSIFRFLKKKFRDWKGSEVMDGFETFDAFVQSELFASDGPDRILRPQLFWLRTSETDETIAVDSVLRAENLDSEFPVLLERIGSSAQERPLERLNASGDPNEWANAYSEDATRARVATRYANDFRTFRFDQLL